MSGRVESRSSIHMLQTPFAPYFNFGESPSVCGNPFEFIRPIRSLSGLAIFTELSDRNVKIVAHDRTRKSSFSLFPATRN